MTERAPNVWYTRNGETVALHVPDPWAACEAWERINPPQPTREMLLGWVEAQRMKKEGKK